MDSVTEKRCSKCELTKAVRDFHRDRKAKDGFRPHCKACRAVYTATKTEKYRIENDSNVPAEKACSDCGLIKSSSEFNRDKDKKSGLQSKCKACYAIYRAADKQRIAVYGAFWRKANAEKSRDYQAGYYFENIEKIRARQKAHYAENTQRIRASHRAYYLDNPEKCSARNRNRHARKLAADGTHTAKDIARQFDAQKGKCWWCGCNLKKSGEGKFHTDHVIPLIKGGSNGPENLVASCAHCNLSKNDKSPLEFAGRLF